MVNSAYVVAGSSSTCGIAVYSLDDCMFLKLLTYHRELPQATACISSRQFVSGSLDGSIIVWNSNSHLAEHTLYNPREYQKDGKKYLYNVSYLLPLHDRYVVAAIGKGFSVFDLYAKDDSSCVVLQCPNAHDAAVTCALSICNGAYLLTSSEDSVIKMWKMPPHLCLGGIKPVSSSFSMSNINTEDRRGSGAPVAPTLVTELYGHVNVVPEIVKIDEYSFASCSSDTEVIIWKDGYRQSELRNMYAVYSLTQDK